MLDKALYNNNKKKKKGEKMIFSHIFSINTGSTKIVKENSTDLKLWERIVQ